MPFEQLWVSGPDDWRDELKDVGMGTKRLQDLPEVVTADTFDLALTAWEKHNKGSYLDQYLAKNLTKPEDDPYCIFGLGQSVDSGWARGCDASKPVMPTFTSGGTVRLYSPHRGMWFPALDKMASYFFPVTKEMAEAAGVRQYRAAPETKPHERVGNTMHVGNALMVLVSAISCIEVLEGEARSEPSEKTEVAVEVERVLACDPACHYEVLGVPVRSGIEDVKKAYKALARQNKMKHFVCF